MPLLLYEQIIPGADPGFSEGGFRIRDGSNPSVVSLKQGVWGVQPLQKLWGIFAFV